MKKISRISILVGLLCCISTSYRAVGGEFFLVDDFESPATATHASLPGESRAAFPPGTSGGSILVLSPESDVAIDRGLFGIAGSMTAGAGQLDLVLPSGFVEIDWNVEGFDFVAMDAENIAIRGLTNQSGQDASLTIELFQTFDGTDSVVGTGNVPVNLAAGETRKILFPAIAGETDFIGFRLVNNGPGTFTGSIDSIVAVPEPGSLGVVALISAAPIAHRRRRRC